MTSKDDGSRDGRDPTRSFLTQKRQTRPALTVSLGSDTNEKHTCVHLLSC